MRLDTVHQTPTTPVYWQEGIAMADCAAKSDTEAILAFCEDKLGGAVYQIEAGEGFTRPRIPILMTPPGLESSSIKALLDEWRAIPECINGRAVLTTLDSFIAHANRFRGPDSVIYCDDAGSAVSLIGVFDYHPPTADERDPGWLRHRSCYAFPLSKEWQVWSAMDGVIMKQIDFAEFLEEHICDVRDPAVAGPAAQELAEQLETTLCPPHRLLELSRGLSVLVGEKAVNKIDPGTGETSVRYEASHSDAAGNALKVPRAFLLGIPVFVDGVPYQIAARLRYRIENGVILWSYKLHQADRCLRDAVREAARLAQSRTEMPLFHGKPEC